MTKIKICGLKSVEDVEMLNRLKPDYAGFVFAGRKRRITPEQAELLRKKLSPEIKSVGVFVNEKPEEAAYLANQGILDFIQLHGEEDAVYIQALRELTDKPIIRAVRVRCSEDILKAQDLPVEFLLLDAYRKDMYGGSGKTFSWDLIPELTKPYFLAGGLSAENVSDAVRRHVPWAVDVSSSVETDGKKDEEKVRKFIEQARAAG